MTMLKEAKMPAEAGAQDGLGLDVRLHLSAEAREELHQAMARPEADGKGIRIYPAGIT